MVSFAGFQKMHTVFIVAPNRFFRESLATLLAAATDVVVLGAAESSASALQQISSLHPNVVVLSPDWRDSEFLATRAIRGVAPFARVLMITMDDDAEVFFKAVRSGAVGYLLKDASADEIVEAVRHLQENPVVCPPHLEGILFDYVANGSAAQVELTQRERQLIPLIGEGLTNKEIAVRLHLSEQTVKNHVHRILRKTGSSSRTSLTRLGKTSEFSPNRATNGPSCSSIS
jgi:DNA-binding NarL/FixJ family response regulator